MHIDKHGKINDVFAKNLADGLSKIAKKDEKTPVEKRLQEDRDELGQKHEEGTLEVILDPNHKKEAYPLTEKQLRDQKHDNKNADLTGTTEKRLEEASTKNYPHRNTDAWERTGDKRPVNALDEEMGSAGDASKQKRYEKASKASQDLPKRIVDKDVGSQLTDAPSKIPSEPVEKAAFNLKKIVEAKKEMAKIAKEEKAVGSYLAYKGQSIPWSKTMNDTKAIDASLSKIMSVASTRQLTKEEMNSISELKKKKSELLGVKKVANTGSWHFDIQSDVVVMGRDPEMADMSNPSGATHGYAAYVRATSPKGARKLKFVHESMSEEEAMAKAQQMADAFNADAKMGKLPADFNQWEHGNPEYGSPGYSAQDHSQDDKNEEDSFNDLPY